MISILEELGFKVTKETIEENIVSRRMENKNNNSVIILEQAFFEPDEIDTTIYIVSGKLNLDTKGFENLKIIE